MAVSPPTPRPDLGRRTLIVLLGAAVLALPAVALRALCVGESCRQQIRPELRVPFCSLEPEVRDLITNGYRPGRSPDVLGVTGDEAVIERDGGDGLPHPWPVADDADAGRVPLVFSGPGVAPTSVPDGTPLADLAPTAAELIDLSVPHPEVRSGTPIEGVASGEPARLLLVVAWKGVGSVDLEARPEAWPHLRRLLRDGAGTLEARVGSRPLDPAAVLTTIGTGGPPREHGITGRLVRNDEGAVSAAWDRNAPFSVIAALGDDLDEVHGQQPRVGIVATSGLDQGAIGRDWYLDTDEDDVVIVHGIRRQVSAARDLLADGYGRDAVPDLLAVVLQDRIGRMDRALGEIVEAAEAAAGGSVAVVVTSTGSVPEAGIDAASIDAAVEREVPDLVEVTTAGGLFLDQDVLVETGASQERVLRALRAIEGSQGGRLFADVFGGRAVEFGKYC